MASRGSALHRALAFFREEADEDIVRLALERATEIVAERGMRGQGKKVHQTRRRRLVEPGLPSQIDAAIKGEALG